MVKRSAKEPLDPQICKRFKKLLYSKMSLVIIALKSFSKIEDTHDEQEQKQE